MRGGAKMSTENVMMIIIIVLIVLIVVYWLMNQRKSYVENFGADVNGIYAQLVGVGNGIASNIRTRGWNDVNCNTTTIDKNKGYSCINFEMDGSKFSGYVPKTTPPGNIPKCPNKLVPIKNNTICGFDEEISKKTDNANDHIIVK